MLLVIGSVDFLGQLIDKQVDRDCKLVLSFGELYKFDTIIALKDFKAKADAIEAFFADQERLCCEHRRNQPKGKYFLMIFYSGLGSLIDGSMHMFLRRQNQNEFFQYPLEQRLRNFGNNH